MRLAFVVWMLAGCSRDLRPLESARERLMERRENLQQLAAEIDREPGQMKRLIAEAELLRTKDPAFDAKSLQATLERAVPKGEVGVAGSYVWVHGNCAALPIAEAVAAAAKAAPHLTIEMVFASAGRCGLDARLPEVALPGAYAAKEEPEDPALPKASFWPGHAERDLRADIERLQSEVAALRKRIGSLDGLPALRGRLEHDHQKLASGSRLDRVALLVTRLFGKEAVFDSGSLHLDGDLARVDARLGDPNGNVAGLVLAVPGAEEAGGDRGWNFDHIEVVGPGHVRGQLAWRSRR